MLCEVNMISTESECPSWVPTKIAQSGLVHGPKTPPFHHPFVPLSVYQYYNYGNCLFNTRLRASSGTIANRTHKVRYNEPLPWDIGDAGANAPSFVPKNFPRYGEPSEAPIIAAIASRSLQLWVCTVESIKRGANDHIRSHPRDPHAAVRTCSIVGATP